MVDIVFPCEDADLELIFERRVRKLIGALQRRFWERRRQMLQARALGDHESATEAEGGSTAGLLTDLSNPHLDWESRVSEYRAVVEQAGIVDADAAQVAIRIRGWNQTEAGILVDGRAVPGCIVDLAVALSHNAEMLRLGFEALLIHIPTPSDHAEAKLWLDLLNLAQDRLGIERETISFVVEGGTVLEDAACFEAVA